MGLARKLFEKTKMKTECKTALHENQFLLFFQETYVLNSIDFILAKSLLRNCCLESEAVIAVLAHLSLAVRNGHLLIKCESQQILPTVRSLWMKESSISEEDLKKFEALVFKGFKEISENVKYLSLFIKNENHLFSGYLFKTGNYLYFQKYFVLEQSIRKLLLLLKDKEPALKIERESIISKANQLEKEGKLLTQQAASLIKAAEKSITILTGGPGTGKTYTAGFLIQALIEEIGDKKIKIAAAAPTGKAAANLQKSLSRFLPPSSKARTLHSLLGIKENGNVNRSQKMLDADLILIDEASMIDISLMNKLLKAVNPGSRLIFLGDPYQLPSVEPGSVFSDFMTILNDSSIHLSTCMRAELAEIVDFSKSINFGDVPFALKLLKEGDAVSLVKEELSKEAVFERAKKHFPLFFKEEMSFNEILNSFNKFRILSPLRKGPFGVDDINAYFFEHLILPSLEMKSVMIPIMLLQNASSLNLFNGETGVLILNPSKSGKFHIKQGDFALFSDNENEIRKIPALMLPLYEYAYCLSVHKSQGSEFDHLLVLVPEGAEYFGRKVLYTAITRAKKKLEIFGTEEIIKKTIQEKGERLSGLNIESF